MPATSGATAALQLGSGGGPTYDTGSNYVYAYEKVQSNATWVGGGSGSTTAWDVTAGIGIRALADSSGNLAGFSGEVTITRNSNKTYHISGALHVTGTAVQALHFGGTYYNNVDVTAVRLVTSSGNWDYGKLALIPITL